MQMRVLSSELLEHEGREVDLAGWVHRVRRLRRVSFVVVRDRAGLVQVVVAPEAADDLREEAVVRVRGRVQANPAAPGGARPHAAAIDVLSQPAGELPFALWRPALDV